MKIICMVKDGNGRAKQRLTSPNLLFKLSWAPENRVSCSL